MGSSALLLFPLLLADPRAPQLAASYSRLGGSDIVEPSLGHTWSLANGRFGDQMWQTELGAEAMSYSRLRVGGGRGDFEAVDFIGNIPLVVRRDDLSLKAMAYHESSHVGDDHVRRDGDPGFRFSTTGLRTIFAIELFEKFRVYGGPEFAFLSNPSPDRWGVQCGAELSHTRRNAKYYVAQDLKSRERVGWQPISRTVLGVRVIDADGRRAARFALGWNAGRSSFGVFFRNAEHRGDVSVALEL